MKTITTTIHNLDAEPMLDSAAMQLLFGVRAEDITALPIVNGAMRIPAEWTKRGRLRTKEAIAHMGSDFILDILDYWAHRDHDAELEVIYA